MMKKLLTGVAAFALLINCAHAQFQNPDTRDVNAVKGRILLVPLQEEVTRTLLDLQKKPEEQKLYKDGIANFNTLLQEAVQKNWKFGKKGVEFMPQSKVNKLLQEGNGKYAVLQYKLREGVLNQLMFGTIYGTEPYNTLVRDASKKEGYSEFDVELPVKDKDPNVVYTVFMPVAYPSAADMYFAVQMISNQFNKYSSVRDYKVEDFDADVKKFNKRLKNRTLLIDRGQITAKTTVQDLKKAYPNRFEIVDYEDIDKAVRSGDSGYVYVQVIPTSPPSSKIGMAKVNVLLEHLVVDAGDGKVMARTQPTRMNYDMTADDISKKEIKDYIE